MKKILYLSFYFEPDLCAGSFRNTPLAKELARQMGENNQLVIITTKPNRYNSFKVDVPDFEQVNNISIHRIKIPEHNSGFFDQILSFRAYYNGARKIFQQSSFDLIFASSSRLFTAYLGYKASGFFKAPLYLDIRDIFVDTMKDVLKNPLIKFSILPVMRFIENRTFSNAKHINLISPGFKPYFNKYPKPAYSFFTNGIDEEFIALPNSTASENTIKKIVYAGNIGEGQGLHLVIPSLAKALEGKAEFLIIGDGGAKAKLIQELNRQNVKNVRLTDPVTRNELRAFYLDTDFFFLHLNNYEAFKKVLPSKIFELGAYDKPIIAGVGGYAGEFFKKYVSNTILFEPGDVQTCVKLISEYKYHLEIRADFINKFKRTNLNREMALSILNYLP